MKIDNLSKKAFFFRMYLILERTTHLLSDSTYLKMLYKRKTGKKLNLSKPESFDEKMQWLKIHNNNSLCQKLVDKANVKEYVSEKVGSQYTIPTIGLYDDIRQIDFSKLPDKYVIKCTHDSGSTIVITDQRNFCKNDYSMLKARMKRDFYWRSRESYYKGLKPRIIIEDYLEGLDGVSEFQFWCFNGVPEFISAINSPHGVNQKLSYSMTWEKLPFVTSMPKLSEDIKKPENFDEMKNIVEILCKDFTFVRVDLLLSKGQIYVGEMTFAPAGGFVRWVPEETDMLLGQKLRID